MEHKKILQIPPPVSRVTETLEKNGFEAYVVGGCVRDLLLGRTPKDWDVTTNAKPEEITSLFPKTFYENSFGTVSVVQEDVEDECLKVIEITPYRIEGKYSNKRHPDDVSFSNSLSDDLQRRDFTINALAYSVSKGHIVDLYSGIKDLEQKVLKAVGNPGERFQEDALRIMRAARIATELGFTVSNETKQEIVNNAALLKEIAIERIQNELSRVTMSDTPMAGFLLMHDLGILRYVLPEIEEGIEVEQNGDHIYDVWEHNLRAVQHSADKKWPLHVRLAALLHDVGKPATRRWSEEKQDWTFYGHDVVGARITEKALQRLKYPSKMVEIVSKLVRHHLFFTDIEKITLSAVRRIVSHMGPENVWDLMKVRACDRIGMGRPKETPYRLRKYEAMIEEAMRAPISVAMLKINGEVLMKKLHVKPGPKMGHILHALLEEVLEEPAKNTEEYLEKRALELNGLPDEEIEKLGKVAREKKEEAEAEEIAEIRKRHWVK